jgi:hypothetical protein
VVINFALWSIQGFSTDETEGKADIGVGFFENLVQLAREGDIMADNAYADCGGA